MQQAKLFYNCQQRHKLFSSFKDLLINKESSGMFQATDIINTENSLQYKRLVVKFYDDCVQANSYGDEVMDNLSGKFQQYWMQLCSQFINLHIGKLFTSLTALQISALMEKAKKGDTGFHVPNLFSYYFITCPQETDLYKLQSALQSIELIEYAYIHGSADSPDSKIKDEPFVFGHGYFNNAPEGVDVDYAWTFEGGKGNNGVKFIDIEQGWQLNKDLMNVTELPLTGFNDERFREHGFAVINIIAKKENTIGSLGIVPEASGHIISEWRPNGMPNEADAILTAIYYLNYGDVLLLESQSYFTGTNNKLWPLEIQEACYSVIRLATALGITVVEAAGNGDIYAGAGNDLDQFTLNDKKIFDRASADFKDSGAIIVAASTLNADHHRIGYSNYGNRIDCYGWGEGIVARGEYYTTDKKINIEYSSRVNGTSAAAAIIAAVVISVQSMVAVKYNTRLSPAEMRSIISNDLFGTSSANGRIKDKIGVMPDLKKIIDGCLTGWPASFTISENNSRSGEA